MIFATSRFQVGKIGDIGVALAAGVDDFLLRRGQLFLAACADQYLRARASNLERRGLADAGRAAGDQRSTALDLAAQRVIDEQVGIEVALPVVPQAPGIAFELRQLDLRAAQRAFGIARVEARRIIDELQRLGRNAEVAQHGIDEALHGRQARKPLLHRGRNEGEHARVEAHRHLRRMARMSKDVEHLADAHRRRVGQVKTVAVKARLVRDVIHRRDNVVDRHHIDAAAFDAEHRHPRRQHLAQFLQRAKEIVRPVDFVDLAGLRMAEHGGRPVDAVRTRAFLAHHGFGFVLGLEVRVLAEVLGFFEHIFAEHAGIEAGDGDRTRVMETTGLGLRRDLHGMARAIDVGLVLTLGVGGEVVYRGEVEEMFDLAAQRLALRGREAEHRLADIALHRDQTFAVVAEAFAQRFELLRRSLAHEAVDRALARIEFFNQVATDESRCAGDEISHVLPRCCP